MADSVNKAPKPCMQARRCPGAWMLFKCQSIGILSGVINTKYINRRITDPIEQCIMLCQDILSDFFLFLNQRKLSGIYRNLLQNIFC